MFSKKVKELLHRLSCLENEQDNNIKHHSFVDRCLQIKIDELKLYIRQYGMYFK